MGFASRCRILLVIAYVDNSGKSLDDSESCHTASARRNHIESPKLFIKLELQMENML